MSESQPALARPRQYVQIRFSCSVIYTYHNDGEPVAKGDFVEIDTPKDGVQRKQVVTAWVGEAPAFDTKPCKKVEAPAPKAAS